MYERLPVRRLPVVRMRGIRTTGVAGPDRVGPVDLTLEAGTMVALRPARRGRVLLDVLQGLIDFCGDIEVVGRPWRGRPDGRPGPLRRVRLGPDGHDRSEAVPAPGAPTTGSTTVRETLTLDRTRFPLGPALPLTAVLDVPVADLDAPIRSLVTIARALREDPDVLLLDAEGLDADSPIPPEMAGPLRDLVALEGRTVLAAADHPVLWSPADSVLTVPSLSVPAS